MKGKAKFRVGDKVRLKPDIEPGRYSGLTLTSEEIEALSGKDLIIGGVETYSSWGTEPDYDIRDTDITVGEAALVPAPKSRIILVGKAASGKDYMRALMVASGFKPDISVTTRPPRKGEQNGVDYNFITEDEFTELDEEGKLHECVRFNGWGYGTTKESWETSDVFIMTPSGISQLSSEDRANCFIIYLDIQMDVRKSRLLQRSDADSVDRRIEADEADFMGFLDYDIRITDHNF